MLWLARASRAPLTPIAIEELEGQSTLRLSTADSRFAVLSAVIGAGLHSKLKLSQKVARPTLISLSIQKFGDFLVFNFCQHLQCGFLFTVCQTYIKILKHIYF